MTEKTSDVDAAIEKLNKLLDDNQITIFTSEESKALKEVAEAWRSAKGFVIVARLTGGTLKWCVGFAITWTAFKAGLFDFLKPHP
jgi:ribosomal protein S2